MFGRNLFALAKRLRANYIRDKERGRKATFLQNRWRQRQARRLMLEKYRTVVTKYIDPVSQRPYWHNPTTERTVWTKPRILAEMGEKYDVRRTVELPFPDVEFSNTCENCSDRVLSKWCQQCDEMTCTECCESLHHAGKKKTHERFSFDVCVECEYQTASRRCRECTDTYCDTCYWRCHKKGNLKLHTWEPLLDLCTFCAEPRTAIAVRVEVQGAANYRIQELDQLGDEAVNVLRPSDDRMCKQCYNTTYYSLGFASTPLEFTCYAIDKEKTRIQNEINENYEKKAKQLAKERDERRKIIKCVSKLQAKWRMKKTGHVWGGRLKNLAIDLRIKKRMDALHKQKQSWWYKVRDTVDKAPVLECDADEEVQQRLIPRKMYRRDIERLYPWMPKKQVDACAYDGVKPEGIFAAPGMAKWVVTGGPIKKIKNGGKAVVSIAGITAEAILGDAFSEDNRDKYALWMAVQAQKRKRKILTAVGKKMNTKYTSIAASLEMKFNSRNMMTKFFRRRARKMYLLSKLQFRLNRRDALFRERWKEIDHFRQVELDKWQKAMDFEANKKYWYHKDSGETTYVDPAIAAKKEKETELTKRKIMTKKRMYGKSKQRGDDGEYEEEDESSDEEAEAVDEQLREELGESDESEYDSEDIPLGSEVWKGKGDDDDSSSGSDSDDSDEEEGGERKVEDGGEYDAAGGGEYDAGGGEYDVAGGEEYGAAGAWDETAAEYDASAEYAGETKDESTDWEQVWDDGSQAYYYYNSATGETRW